MEESERGDGHSNQNSVPNSISFASNSNSSNFNSPDVNSPLFNINCSGSIVNLPTSNLIVDSVEDLGPSGETESNHLNAWNSCGTVETHLGANSQEDLV